MSSSTPLLQVAMELSRILRESIVSTITIVITNAVLTMH
jgi:hypothetical protein